MSTPQITAVALTDVTEPSGAVGAPGRQTPGARDVLIVGAGLGTGVQVLWQHAANQLADRFQVIGWDLPGHGLSPAHAEPFSLADLADAVVQLVRTQRESGTIAADAKVYYAGVSVNGQIALQLGLEHGDLFAGIASICSAAKIGERESWLERAKTVEASGTPTMVVGSAQRWFAPGFIEKHPERSTGLLHTLQDADRFSYARVSEAIADFDVRDRLGEITVPILAINGAEDTVCSPEQAQQTAEGVQHGQAHTIAGVAHQAPLEDPEETARLLKEGFGA